MKRIATLLVAAALAVTTLAACGGGDKKTVKIPGGGSVSVDRDGKDGTVSFTDDEGNKSSFGASTEVPDDFPKDVPLPDDAKLTGSIFGETDGQQGWTLTFESTEDVAAFAKAYRATLEDAGFKVDSFSVMGSGEGGTAPADPTSTTG